MEELQNEIDRVIENSSYQNNNREFTIPARVFQAQFNTSSEVDWTEVFDKFCHWSIWLHPEFVNSVSKLIVKEFNEFVDENEKSNDPINANIGLGYRYLIADISKLEVKSFKIHNLVRDIVNASVIRGSDHVIRCIEKWKRREQLSFTRKGIILGIYVNEPIRIGRGVKLVPADYNQTNLDIYFDHFLREKKLKLDFDRRCTLEIEYKRPSALFPVENISEFTSEFKQLQSDSLDFKKYCEMLSLASKCHAMPILTWFDVGDELCGFPIPSLPTILMNEHLINESIEFTSEMGERTEKFYQGCTKVSNFQPKQAIALDISVSKWLDSKRSNEFKSINDRCVDMRIALEGLFLSRENGIEKLGSASQISILCSCILDENPSKETESFLTLKSFYNLSSGIVHASIGLKSRLKDAHKLLAKFKHLDSKVIEKREDFLNLENADLIKRKLLERAQFFYSEAIDEILKMGEIPNWKEEVHYQIERGNFAWVSQQQM